MTTATETIESVGRRIGQAMAKDTIADNLPREWTGLTAEDVDQIPGGMDHDEVERLAQDAYDAIELAEVTAVLLSHGEMFHGGTPADIAQDWIDHDFDADEVDSWCEVGCWDASTAAEFRDAGLSPRQAKEAADKLDDQEDERPTYDAIYRACNADLRAQAIIDAAKD
jgi:hypothetical protein